MEVGVALELEKDKNELIIEASLLAGKIMLENGAETSRVEDTMERIIRNALGDKKGDRPYTYVTVNGLFARLEHGGTNFVRIDTRSFDMDKITKVNQLSRSFAENTITLIDMFAELKMIEKEKMSIPLILKMVCTMGLSGSVMMIFGGHFINLPAAMIAGLVAYTIYLLAWKYVRVPFLSEYAGAFLGGISGYLVSLVVGDQIDLIMVGAVVPLVPGITITNAIRDIMAMHYLSGLIRAIEGICIAGALGAGIATVYYIFII
ncbi:threonine/serine ThrE exporter family protein [Bacillus sp. 1P06AnD]|uniref:threonine/serine ThrE exporter family protein n=1 Tax=Bacillus sp. 1P06AnD TaxID=3132208 RepID=UPI0039A09157